ncbi:MAG: hypothetical protein ABEJ43_09705 [Haloferacaceae archaeon]
MSLARDARDGLRIARAELRRSVREYLGDTRRLVGVTVVALVFGGYLLVFLPTVFVAGRGIRRVGAIPGFGLAATLLPVALLAVAALRTLERIGRVEAADLILLVVRPRAVVLGLVGAEAGRLALWFSLPAAAVVAAFAAGLGAPTLPLTAALVLLPLAACAAVWGYASGLVVLRVLRRLPGVRRVLKGVAGLAFVVAIVGSQVLGTYVASGGVAVDRLLASGGVGPLADYLALAFVGTPLARPVGAGTAAVPVVLLALVPVGLAVATRQASALWFTDAPRQGASAERSSGGFAPPEPFARTGAGRVAWGLLVRGVRQPSEFAHLVMVLVVLGPGTASVAQVDGPAGPLVAGVGTLLGVHLAGATFGLNPLGDDRPQLPLLLLTRATPRTLVRGRVAAGLAVGVPVVLLATGGSVALGTPPLAAAALAVVGAALCLAASAFAVGVGAGYPVYETREFWGTETVVPSTLVTIAYLVVVGAGTAVGLVVTWVLAAGLEPTPLVLGGLGVYALVTVVPSYGSYRYAVRRYRRYTVE